MHHLLAVEKNNDSAKRVFFRSSNRWDAATDILKHEYRLDKLSHCERQKRPYE